MAAQYISPSAREARCPFCGAVLFLDDEQQRTHHEAPLCPKFAAKMREFGAEQSITIVPEKGKA